MKDFRQWHTWKTEIERSHQVPFFREQEIWWCSLGLNVGVEEDGKSWMFQRPILVFRKFSKEVFWGLPMTTKKKEGIFYHSFPLFGEERTTILSQLRALSGKRLIRRLGKISDAQFALLQSAFSHLCKETDPLRDPRVPNGNL